MNALVDHKAFAAAAPVSTDVSLFDFKGHQIRVVTIGGEPWFVAKDVIFALSYDRVDHALRRLDQVERQVAKPSDPHLVGGVEKFRSLFGTPARNVSLVSESGLYKLVLRSDKPEAKPFQDWVTKEVLPAIRKDGAYVMGEEKVPKDVIGSRLYVYASCPPAQRSDSSPFLTERARCITP